MRKETMITVLIVEDDIAYAKALKFIIENADNNVMIANNVINAIKILTRQNISLICTDYNLPDGTALEILKWIKHKNVKIPTIVISAEDSLFYEEKVIVAGASLYIDKAKFNIAQFKETLVGLST